MKIKHLKNLKYAILISVLHFMACTNSIPINNPEEMRFPNAKSDEEWKEMLTPFQYDVLRKSFTERPFTGEYYNIKDTGIYYCVACDDLLFRSDTKFESSCGWPSFFEPVSDKSLVFREDSTYEMIRKEVLCGGCGGHLGHVFKDGPPPTGLRYCINSASLRFEKEKELKK